MRLHAGEGICVRFCEQDRWLHGSARAGSDLPKNSSDFPVCELSNFPITNILTLEAARQSTEASGVGDSSCEALLGSIRVGRQAQLSRSMTTLSGAWEPTEDPLEDSRVAE